MDFRKPSQRRLKSLNLYVDQSQRAAMRCASTNFYLMLVFTYALSQLRKRIAEREVESGFSDFNPFQSGGEESPERKRRRKVAYGLN